MRKKIVLFCASAVLLLVSLSGCGALQQGVEDPVRGATQQVQKARDVQQQVEDVQQSQQQ